MFLRDLPWTLQPQARALASAMLRSDAPLLLTNARLHVERSEEAFALSISVLDRPVVTRRLALQCPPWLVPQLRQEEERRRATLRIAAGLAEDAGPVP